MVGDASIGETRDDASIGAMASGNHNLYVHLSSNIHCIRIVDPDRYCYVDLMDDVCKKAFGGLGTQAGSVMIYCDNPNSSTKMFVGGDTDMLKMFQMNQHKQNINLYAEVQQMSTQCSQVRPIALPPSMGENDYGEAEKDRTHDEADGDNAKEELDDVFGFNEEDVEGGIHQRTCQRATVREKGKADVGTPTNQNAHVDLDARVSGLNNSQSIGEKVFNVSQLINDSQLSRGRVYNVSQLINNSQLSQGRVYNVSQLINDPQLSRGRVYNVSQLINDSQLSRGRVYNVSQLSQGRVLNNSQLSRGRGLNNSQASRGRGFNNSQASRGRVFNNSQSSRGRGLNNPQASQGRGLNNSQSNR